MEIGAVKQAFNNEVIHLKKPLNQSRIQVIHKLTRKAKTLVTGKGPEILQAKRKRKAEAAVQEVLVMKKLKPKDLAKFIVTHKGDLNSYMNKPLVNSDKACARLLLHKLLQDKYKSIRDKYSNISIDDLFMSRAERQKLKKEQKELMNKKKNNRSKKTSISSDGDWNVLDVNESLNNKEFKGKESSDESDDQSQDVDSTKNNELVSDDESDNEEMLVEDIEHNGGNKEDGSSEELDDFPGAFVKINNKTADETVTEVKIKDTNVKSPKDKKEQTKSNINDKRAKLPKLNKNKTKKIDDKIHKKTFTKTNEPEASNSNTVVDPFFKTLSGDNYLTLAEPRAPDEVKAIHRQGNRKLRRAVMFGHVPKGKPRPHFSTNYDDNERFGKDQSRHFNRFNKNDFNTNNNFDRNNKFDNRQSSNSSKFINNDNLRNSSDKHYNKYKSEGFNKIDINNKFKETKDMKQSAENDTKPEKLHPSWEAKKKISNILPFKGKKTVFDDN